MLTIGKLAARSGVPVSTLRYYERLGLLNPWRRSEGGFRLYGDDAVERLRFIKGLQALGIPLRNVRQVLAVRDEGMAPCQHVLELLSHQAKHVEARIAELTALRQDLEGLARQLEATVTPGARSAEECACLRVTAEFDRRKEAIRRGV